MFYKVLINFLVFINSPKYQQPLSAVQASTKPSLVVDDVLGVAPAPAGGGTLGWELGGMGHRKYKYLGGSRQGKCLEVQSPGKTESPLSAPFRGKDRG